MIFLAKTYISSVKYLVKIKFEVQGVVDKPDVIGAIFGQSEGLLGEEMDLKELQKNGKIGRIEINHEHMLGKTSGEILLPSNMDMVQTSILAAAVESVEKVGPYESKFEIEALEDTRSEKRDEIKKRAQELLKKFKATVEPDTVELTESIREESRASDLKAFGQEKLPAGPEIEPSDEIIVVEGRADVITLLKNHIKNVIAMQGSTIPNTIIELSKRKKVTIFVDGDRGGEMIAKNFLLSASAEFVARAPDGKEVEELTRKEIIQSLRRRVNAQEFLDQLKKPAQAQTVFAQRPQREFGRPMRRNSFQPRTGPTRRFGQRPMNRFRNPMRSMVREFETKQPSFEFEQPPSKEEQDLFLPILKELKDSGKAKLFDSEMKETGEVKIKQLVSEVSKKKGLHAIVFDGIVTKRLVEASEKSGATYIVGVRKGDIGNPKTKVLTFSNA
ncbi:MAG: DNA primase [Candidatus Diapherotrites archaeon]|nr:DNA primase [Candidatus Diapherotrites archaeon]